jgi:NitT/TauT family transport system permease protein
MDLSIPLATLATVGRIFLLIALAIVSGHLLAYAAIKSRAFENVYVPLVNVFESIPVIGFLPLVLVAFILTFHGAVGVELAVDFLVFDAVAWNVWIGIYQAFKTVPLHLVEVADNYNMGFWKKMTTLFVPHSVPRLTSNIFSSFADAFFYISVSEVFSAGAATASLCPAGTCSTFGIGTLITQYTASGNYVEVYYCLISIAVAVIAVTLVLSRLSRWALAKFGVDTPGVIRRHAGRWRGRLVTNPWRAFRNQTNVFRGYASRLRPAPRGGQPEEGIARRAKVTRYAWISMALAVLSLLLYSTGRVVTSVSAQTWYGFFRETPQLLEYVGADYVRVSLIAVASLALAVTLGYVLATHRRAGDAALPLIQVLAAFPAPTYFPLIFIATLPFLENALPSLYSEVFIFVLGFLSCFYYVFFDFWIGVQAIPSEFVEVTRNYKLPFLTRMRRVILPSSLPYLITGLSSTINSAWAGIAIGEYWPNIAPKVAPNGLQVKFGMMYYISSNMASGQIAAAAYVSLLFAIVVAIYGIVFTRNLMDLARRKYVVEEGIFAA